jgi:uncharacterized protein (TIGR04255 family)
MTLVTRLKEMIALTEEPHLHSSDDPYPHLRTDRHYAHAPITEAIIEIRCELPADVSLDDLKPVADASQFPLVGPALQISGHINVTEAGITSDTSGEQIGHLFRRSDGRRLIQARLNGFAFSAFAPYDRWETFSEEVWSNWLKYQSIARPIRATRLGVRYVNRINVPQNSIEIKDYLRTAIDISPYLPQMMAGYFLQTIVPLPRFDATATIVSTPIPPPDKDTSSLILDIDIWRNVDIELAPPAGTEVLSDQVEVLRKAKNYVFEACITDATRSLIS